MSERRVYQAIASKLAAIANCEKSNNLEWGARHTADVDALVKSELPSGSGCDRGTELNWERSTPNKLVFRVDYHHMSDGGYYDGWTSHTVTVKPSLAFGIDIHVGGSNRNDIGGYLHDLFAECLRRELPAPAAC